MDIWIVWAKLAAQTTGFLPTAAPKFLSGPKKFNKNLGIVSIDEDEEQGRICIIAEVMPVGAYLVVKNNWRMKQEKYLYDFADKIPVSGRFDVGWQPDGPMPSYSTSYLDSSDSFYAIDGPNITRLYSAVNTVERYDNFRIHAEWNGEVASDMFKWHFKGIWRRSGSPKFELRTWEWASNNFRKCRFSCKTQTFRFSE